MERNELIKALESMLTEKIPYGDLVGAEGLYAHSGLLVYEDPESYFIEQAIGDVKELSQIKDILGDDYDLSRLRELVQADREGRCVVLPFKVGDTAWFTIYGGRPVSSEVSSVAITFRVDGAHYYFETENEDGATDYFHGEAIGKTVFLTCEAAEEALKGEP